MNDNSFKGVDLKDTSFSGLVLFYSDGCGHCQKLKPVWTQLSQSFPKNISQVDGAANPNIVQVLQIAGFPDVHLFVKGEHIGRYSGPRTFEGYQAYLKKSLGGSSGTNGNGNGTVAKKCGWNWCILLYLALLVFAGLGVWFILTRRKKSA